MIWITVLKRGRNKAIAKIKFELIVVAMVGERVDYFEGIDKAELASTCEVLRVMFLPHAHTVFLADA